MNTNSLSTLQSSKILVIFITSIIIAVVSVVTTEINIYGLNLGLSLALFSILSMIIAMSMIYQGVVPVLSFLLFLTLSFNTELPLISHGENGFSNSHPNGLRASIVINHFYMIIIIWFLVAFLNNKLKNKKIKFQVSLEFLLFIFIFIFGLLSLMLAENKLAASYPLIRLFFILLLFYAFSTITIERVWKYIIAASGIIVLFQFLIGLYQIFTGEALGLTFLGESSEPFRSTSMISISERGMSGTLGHPGVLGIFIVLLFTFVFAVYINHTKSLITYNIAFLLIILLCVITVLLTNARTSILLLLVDMIIIIFGSLIIRKRNNRPVKRISNIMILMFIILVGCVIVSFDYLYNRFGDSDFIYQIFYRLYLSELSLDVFTENIKNVFFGIGLNNYTDIVSNLGNGFEYSNPVHNFYLLNLVEGGIFFFFSFILLIITVTVKMSKIILKGNFKQSIIALSILSFIIIIGIYNFTGWSGSKNQIFFFFAIVCIMSSKLYKEYKGNWGD